MTIRVVLADDEPLVRSGIALLLASDPDIEVVAEVGDGQQAVEAAGRLHPDVVVMDVRMPVMDGVEATRQIASPPLTGQEQIPVLILTTYNLDEAVYSALCAGAAGFLLKDAAPAELLAAIKAIAGGEGWLDPGVTRSLIKEFAARTGWVSAAAGSRLDAYRAGVDDPLEPSGTADQAILQRKGDYWTVCFEGKLRYLKDSTGLRYLSMLLRHPGREMHALDLVAATETVAPVRTGFLESAVGPDLGHAGPLLDETAKAQYKRHIAELQEDLDEAERWADTGRASRAREELEQIADELARSTGLGGRDRLGASAAERARVNVTKAIKAAIRRIEKENPALGRHLSLFVRTGVFCSYSPENPAAFNWLL